MLLEHDELITNLLDEGGVVQDALSLLFLAVVKFVLFAERERGKVGGRKGIIG